jgi:transcriptional regulator with XRE-family HTH domain
MGRKQSIREVLGEQLKAFRIERGLTAYKVAKKGSIRQEQVKTIEQGDTNYTIDVFLGYIHGCDLYIYFAEKDNVNDTCDFNELIEKGFDKGSE